MATRIIVIGAGAFGSWTAYTLQQRGAQVTLLDAWGPGHSRASSGGETRITRGVYGPHSIYGKMVAQTFPLWREFEERWNVRCYVHTGALWLFSVDDERYVTQAVPYLTELGLPVHRLDLDDVAHRYPQIGLDDIRSAWWEEKAGFLYARRSCQWVRDALVSSGGEYRQRQAKPGPLGNGRLSGITLSDGSRLEADAYVFACGPWLTKLFPDLLGEPLQISRQEVYFFAPPPGEDFQHPALPVWLEFGPSFYYGIPDGEGRGFKVADDVRAHTRFDPDEDDRSPTPQRIDEAREFLSRRFPRLEGAPLAEARVCQYTNSPDGHLVIDRHPEAANVWIAGAGTGHGFKLGPAVGQYLAGQLLDGSPAEPEFVIGRLAMMSGGGYNQFAARE